MPAFRMPNQYQEAELNDQTVRPDRIQRLRGRRLKGPNQTSWSNDHMFRGASFKRHVPYARRPVNFTAGQMFGPSSALDVATLGSMHDLTNGSPHQVEHQRTNCSACENQGNVGNQNHAFEQPSSSSMNRNHAKYNHQPIGNPVVVLNPVEPREIFIGGVRSVPLPLWAYKKCLTMVRGEPHELGPRLCLRLLQSLFSLQYLVTHNYNGSGGKAPIDQTVMGAVLRQAQIQFGSGYFFTEPMALGKLRDYLNNAFRVMAFRKRKGERVRSPFWNELGEPVHGLDAPAEFAETADVIVLTTASDPDKELALPVADRTVAYSNSSGTLQLSEDQNND